MLREITSLNVQVCEYLTTALIYKNEFEIGVHEYLMLLMNQFSNSCFVNRTLCYRGTKHGLPRSIHSVVDNEKNSCQAYAKYYNKNTMSLKFSYQNN